MSTPFDPPTEQIPAVQPPNRQKRWPWVVGIIAAAAVGGGVGFGAGANGVDTPESDVTTPPPSAAEPYEPAEPAIEEPTSEPPTAEDFQIELKTVSKQCFGSAGCNVEVTPIINFSGEYAALDTYLCDVTYTITGDESGEIIETMEGQGGTEFTVFNSSLATPSSNVTPKASVTSVECY